LADQGDDRVKAGHLFPILLLVVLAAAVALAAGQREIVVAQDGSGDHRTIQAALESLPATDDPVTIIIRKGVYQEKLFLTRPYVTLVGEDRVSTRIVYPELRRNWTAAHHGSDRGAATVNIDTTAHDITFANLTIYNNYGSLHGDHDHQFAIRGWSTRIILLGCDVIADGGDTISLWDHEHGMYYHADCAFEGWVDYICPRGWCFVRDSRFFGHNTPSASFWHDGSKNRSMKFVITDSFIDGVAGFPLGRNHRDGQLFFVRCGFSANMADRPIYHPAGSQTQWQWGARHYFWGSHRTCGDYAWFADNLEHADPPVRVEQIDARWAFDGRWDPEANLPSLLPRAIAPFPANGAERVTRNPIELRWVPARNARAQRVVMAPGTPEEVEVAGDVRRWTAGALAPQTRYTWRVDALGIADTVRGTTWTFTTE
jgi:pectinesterase